MLEVAAVAVKVTVKVILGAAPSTGAASVTADDTHHLRRGGVGEVGGAGGGRWKSCPHAADECVRSASESRRGSTHVRSSA